MNINSLTIRNIRSFGEPITIDFENGLNIFIGPNAGGKSNLLDILNVILNYFFVKNWRIIEEYTSFNTLRRRYFQEENIFNPTEILDKHTAKVNEDQEISISFSADEEDTLNIRHILSAAEKLKKFEKDEFSSTLLQDRFLTSIDGASLEKLKGRKITFSIKNWSLNIVNSSEEEVKIASMFLRYLNTFEFLQLLILEFNSQNEDKILSLYPPFCYFSPYRIPQIQALIARVAEVDFYQLKATYKRSNSREVSTILELATHYFARKLRAYHEDFSKFNSDEEVKLVKDYVTILGYKDFSFKELDRYKNRYQLIITKRNGEELDLTRASSGEKEIFNLLLGVFALNIKNGVVLIDEPELHLHPKWQTILLDLFYKFSQERGIQWFIVTHSPHFVNPSSIKNVFRVFRDESTYSKIIKPASFTEDERDLLMMVNITNSTKIFFSDKVILVEGIVDRVIYGAILGRLQSGNKDQQIIEILDVQQLGGFEKNQSFLSKWSLNSYIVADKDKENLPNLDNAYFLQKGQIEDYFQSVVSKTKYDIDDALEISKKILDKSVDIPEELAGYFKQIISQ